MKEKTIYLIGGTMGVGKTTVCRLLKEKLERSVFLDGDWCWDMHPFQVTEETKQMVMNNICYLLNQFLHCSVYDYVIFCWVMHQQEILEQLLSRLDTQEWQVKTVSLVCTPQALESRLQKDIQQGIRQPDVLQRSIARLPLYAQLNTIQLDVSDQTPQQTAEQLLRL